MSDLIELAYGARPWLPSDTASEEVVLDRHNIPLAGILSQYGQLFLYVCAAGEEENANAWIYAHIGEDEAEALIDAPASEVVGAMAKCIQGRMVVVALAGDWELLDWDHFDAGIEGPGVLVKRYLRRYNAKLDQRRDMANQVNSDPSISDSTLDDERQPSPC